ncbi:hypothetical protein VAA_02101 [Vibrio anguillarum 775]|nr:hypothetical protein VAA_02101 [Vibrio anguillarum 775]
MYLVEPLILVAQFSQTQFMILILLRKLKPYHL